MKQKRRPEIMTPGLKMLTPLEQKTVIRHIADNKQRWEHLFSLNKWKPQKPKSSDLKPRSLNSKPTSKP